MIWVAEYGSCARVWISWHYSILLNSISGASVGGNSLQKSVSSKYRVIVSGLPYYASSCARIACTVIVKFHPVNVGMFDTLNWLKLICRAFWNMLDLCWLMTLSSSCHIWWHCQSSWLLLELQTMGRLGWLPGLPGPRTELVPEVRWHLDPLLSRTISGLGFAGIQVVLRLV